jgi:hypothetical protein
MGIESGKKKMIEKIAKSTLQAATVVAAITAGPGESMAGKREATIRAFEPKMSDTLKPGAVAEDVPKDDPKEPKIKWKIQE